MKKLVLLGLMLLGFWGVAQADTSNMVQIKLQIVGGFDVWLDTYTLDFGELSEGDISTQTFHVSVKTMRNRHWQMLLAGSQLTNEVTGSTIAVNYLQYMVSTGVYGGYWQTMPAEGGVIFSSAQEQENGDIFEFDLSLEASVPIGAPLGNYTSVIVISLGKRRD